MTKLISLLIMLQSLSCFAYLLPYSPSTLIESTCNKTQFFDLCVSTLESDPRSRTADESNLARIVADSLNAKAIATLNQIGSLIKNSTERYSRKALNECFDLYNNILQADIPVPIEAIEKWNPKFAVESAANAGNEAQKCEDDFGENSPIYVGNKAVHDLSLVLQSIASLLLY